MGSDEQTMVCLRWAADLNADGIGFLGPTVIKQGPLAEYSSACALGLVRCVAPDAKGSRPGLDWRPFGYWLTEAGRATLGLPKVA
jgi:hypothetical protein